MSQLTAGLITILAAIVGIATLSVILSKNAQTVGVLQAGSQGFVSILNAAEGPVSGNALSGGF